MPSHPITLIYGSSASLRRRAVTQIVEDALPESEREWGLVTLEAKEAGVEGISGQLSGGSLMASDRVVVVRNVEKLATAAQNALAKALARVSPGTTVVLDAEAASDSRKKGAPVSAELRKALEAKGQIIEATVPDDRELPLWVTEEAKARGKTLAPAVARVLVEVVGPHVDMLVSELEKLITYVGPEARAVTEADVREIACGEHESTVFELVDAIGQRNAGAALSVLPELLPAGGGHGAGMPILAMISRQLRLIWQAKALGAARAPLEARTPPPEWVDRLPEEHNFYTSTAGRSFLVRKYSEQARNFSDNQLIRAMLAVYETDLSLKGQTKERMDDRLALETLIVELCRP